jgi:hypothetical protein
MTLSRTVLPAVAAWTAAVTLLHLWLNTDTFARTPPAGSGSGSCR